MDGLNKFRLDGKVAIITGGAGFLGCRHAKAIALSGGIPVIWDLREKAAFATANDISSLYGCRSLGMKVDITSLESIKKGLRTVLREFNKVHILINNAANNPGVAKGRSLNRSRLENFDLDSWSKDISVGLTGAFLCSQVVGQYLATHGGGVILNVASDLGVIAPDQRIYRKFGLKEKEQLVKPVSYSVIKHGIIGLTKYLATYWAEKNVRANSISPGGVYSGQPVNFVKKLSNLIPMGRMAKSDEYEAAVVFLVSGASSYMTGANLIIDGGRSCW